MDHHLIWAAACVCGLSIPTTAWAQEPVEGLTPPPIGSVGFWNLPDDLPVVDYVYGGGGGIVVSEGEGEPIEPYVDVGDEPVPAAVVGGLHVVRALMYVMAAPIAVLVAMSRALTRSSGIP